MKPDAFYIHVTCFCSRFFLLDVPSIRMKFMGIIYVTMRPVEAMEGFGYNDKRWGYRPSVC